MSFRTCRIKGCESVHPRSMFCCKAHWYELPKALREAIWSAYRNEGVLSEEYAQAAEAAEAFLEGREPKTETVP